MIISNDDEMDNFFSQKISSCSRNQKVVLFRFLNYNHFMISYYIVEVEGEGCYCLCYDDVDGNRVVVDWDLEIRED
jgi:hypothetical protein